MDGGGKEGTTNRLRYGFKSHQSTIISLVEYGITARSLPVVVGQIT